MNNVYFLTRIRRTNNTWDKGTEVHETLEEAQGAYYSFLGNFGYGRHPETDFCMAYITDTNCTVVLIDAWKKANSVN